MAYALWTDAKRHLDDAALANATGELDISRLQAFAEDEASVLDTELSGRFSVPVSPSASPETHKLCVLITGLRAAAKYIRWAFSASATEEQTWIAAALEAEAARLVELLCSRAALADAEGPATAFQAVPTVSEMPAPAFSRDNLETGSTHW